MAPQREWFEKDYYKVLGVPDTSTPKEITKAYRQLARTSHPDAKPGDAAAEDRFKDISAAYDVLGDETKRKEYDEVRKLGPMGNPYGAGGGGFGAGRGGAGGQSFNVDAGGLGDLLGGLFGRGNRGRGGGFGGQGVGPQRGTDLEASLTLSFVDAATGITTTLSITSDASCSTCQGSGAAPGTVPHMCSVCSGRGVVDDNQGFFSFSAPCTNCAGRGVIIDTPCPTCRGSGVERRPRQVNVRIPAGVDDGQRIRLKGRGGPGANGGPPGDLFVVCHVQPHKLFTRDGKNLLVRVPVTFAEAALGADIEVPILDGSNVVIRLKPGTQPGAKNRVKGKGITTTTGSGDLIVSVDVVVPVKLSDDERIAVESLQRLATTSPRANLEL